MVSISRGCTSTSMAHPVVTVHMAHVGRISGPAGVGLRPCVWRPCSKGLYTGETRSSSPQRRAPHMAMGVSAHGCIDQVSGRR